MEIVKIIRKLIILFILTEIVNAGDIILRVHDDDNNDSSLLNNSILFPQNFTRCPMYGKPCKTLIFFQKDLNISFKSSESKFFKFLRIESCNDTNCFNNQKQSWFNMSLNYYQFKLLVIESIIVGKAFILFKTDNDDLITKHSVIITSPERLVDSIQTYYVIVFQALISVFMGILLDVKTIVKIVKMPIPVIIGFITQYFGMPLVSKNRNNSTSTTITL